jgi:sugar lactone lactonase YvrE
LRITTAKTLVGIQSGLKFPCSPRWFRQRLLFLDIHDRCIKSADLRGSVQTARGLPYLPGSFEVLDDGGLVLGDALGRKIYRCNEAGDKQIVDLGSEPGHHLSEAIIDGRGGMYVGDIGFNFLDPLIDPVSNGVILYIGSNGKSKVVAENLFFPSGITISPNSKTLIVAETLAHQLTAFEIEKDGSLRNRRVWARLQDEIRPYGVCSDLDGAIWVAGAGLCALHVREGGEIDQQIST